MTSVTQAAQPASRLAESSRAEERAYVFLASYFAAMHLLPFAQMVSGWSFRLFAIVDGFGLIAAVLGIGYLRRRFAGANPSLTVLDALVLGYIGLALASGLLFLQGNNPASAIAYLYGIHYVVFPCLTFFAVKRLAIGGQVRLLRLIVALNVLLVGVGLMVFYWQPDFYTQFMIRSFHGEITEMWQLYGRLGSYLGSTTVGIMAGLTLLFVDFSTTRIWPKAALCGILVVGGVLSQQRGGYVALAVGLGYQVLVARGSLRKKILTVVALAVLAGSILVMFDRRNAELGDRLDLLSYSWNRMSNEFLSWNTFAERRAGYVRALSLVRTFPLGLGVGATLSAADSAGANPGGQVVDANYMRILADMGVVGLVLFLAILAAASRKALRTSRRLLWLSVLVIYAAIAVGTNVFDSFYVSHLYWALLGILDAGAAGTARDPLRRVRRRVGADSGLGALPDPTSAPAGA